MNLKNSAGMRTFGVVTGLFPTTWVIKAFADVRMRYKEKFCFYPNYKGIKHIKTIILDYDCHHYEIIEDKKHPDEYQITIELYDHDDVWSTKAEIEFTITEY